MLDAREISHAVANSNNSLFGQRNRHDYIIFHKGNEKRDFQRTSLSSVRAVTIHVARDAVETDVVNMAIYFDISLHLGSMETRKELHVFTHTRTCTCTRTRVHTHTHTHAHTMTRACVLKCTFAKHTGSQLRHRQANGAGSRFGKTHTQIRHDTAKKNLFANTKKKCCSVCYSGWVVCKRIHQICIQTAGEQQKQHVKTRQAVNNQFFEWKLTTCFFKIQKCQRADVCKRICSFWLSNMSKTWLNWVCTPVFVCRILQNWQEISFPLKFWKQFSKMINLPTMLVIYFLSLFGLQTWSRPSFLSPLSLSLFSVSRTCLSCLFPLFLPSVPVRSLQKTGLQDKLLCVWLRKEHAILCLNNCWWPFCWKNEIEALGFARQTAVAVNRSGKPFDFQSDLMRLSIESWRTHRLEKMITNLESTPVKVFAPKTTHCSRIWVDTNLTKTRPIVKAIKKWTLDH